MTMQSGEAQRTACSSWPRARGGLIWIFFTTEDTEHTEFFLGLEEGDFGQSGWSSRASKESQLRNG